MADIFRYFPVLIVACTSLLLLLRPNWRISIFALSLQYVAIFWMTLSVWPTGLSAVKLVAGWMAGAILGATISGEQFDNVPTQKGIEEIRFRMLLGIFIWIVVIAITPGMKGWLPLSNDLLIGGGILLGIGLLQLGLTTHPLRVIFGLLTAFSGFEIMYAGLEQSVMVAGFLAIISIGISFIGSFIINMTLENIST